VGDEYGWNKRENSLAEAAAAGTVVEAMEEVTIEDIIEAHPRGMFGETAHDQQGDTDYCSRICPVMHPGKT